MKILWLVHLEPDYGESMLYDGLCKVLGDENMIDFPYKYTHHGQEEKVANKNVRHYLDSNPTELHYLRGHYKPEKPGYSPHYSGPYEWEMNHSGIDYHYADILNMVNTCYFDLIVLAHPRAIPIWFLEQLFKDLGNVHEKAPIVMCDFEDYHELRFDIFQKFSINLAFKAAYVQNEPNVYGLPLCSPFINNPKYIIDDTHKTIDVVARWGLTHPLRQEVLNEIQQIQGIAGVAVANDGVVHTMLPHKEYLKEIASSKIGVSMGGHGNLNRNPNRHWEIPSYRTMMICEDPKINYSHPFEDKKHCALFDPKVRGDAKQKIEYYINHEDERQAIAEAGHEHLKKYHTTVARAKYFLEICTKYYPQLKGK